MAIARMKRIQILAHKSARADVVAALREGGALHITEPSVDPADAARREPPQDVVRRLQGELTKLQHVRQFLKPYAPRISGLHALAAPKVLVSDDELRATLEAADVDAWYRRCVELEGMVRSADAEILRRETLAAELNRWAGLGMPVGDAKDTARVAVGLATVAATDAGALPSALASGARETAVVEVSRNSSTACVAILFHHDTASAVSPILKRYNVRWVDLSGASGLPEDAVRRLLEEADAARARIDGLRAEAAALADEYSRVLIVLDEAAERLAKETAQERFAATRETFLVEGWVRGRDEAALVGRLRAISPAIEMRSREPEPGEDVPVDFDNRPLVKPCEFVVTMYGRPAYWEWDPTPLIAPFFILFFGLCVGDVIYGAAIALAALLLISRLPKGNAARVALQLLVMGGAASMLVGVLTGSWAGIAASSLPSPLRRATLIDPLAEPMTMLNIVFLFGLIHVLLGVAVKMAMNFKEGRWLDAVLDELVWIVLIAALAPLGFKFIFGGSVSDAVIGACRTWAIVFLAIAAVTGGRKNRNPVLKVLGGIPKLYGVVNYFADVLSYARLLALGLATSAIALAINGVGEMASGMPVIGPVLMVLVLLGGHVFNCTINILGAFVHPARLQYLEFFGKFFTGGGRPFTPFRSERRYSTVSR
ncbi:MAG: V-type ATP synthase subunit I [Candidatus Eisenbacteria bacterium]|nr:V-type ATP synthase subunit I [Candidatus Eisenbacteria bacterium]